MKVITWNFKKNELLKRERGISFEEVLVYMQEGGLMATIKHPNQEKFGHQKVFVVRIRDYIYLVPFVRSKSGIFLKTIIPSRKLTKSYIEDDHYGN